MGIGSSCAHWVMVQMLTRIVLAPREADKLHSFIGNCLEASLGLAGLRPRGPQSTSVSPPPPAPLVGMALTDDYYWEGLGAAGPEGVVPPGAHSWGWCSAWGWQLDLESRAERKPLKSGWGYITPVLISAKQWRSGISAGLLRAATMSLPRPSYPPTSLHPAHLSPSNWAPVLLSSCLRARSHQPL